MREREGSARAENMGGMVFDEIEVVEKTHRLLHVHEVPVDLSKPCLKDTLLFQRKGGSLFIPLPDVNLGLLQRFRDLRRDLLLVLRQLPSLRLQRKHCLVHLAGLRLGTAASITTIVTYKSQVSFVSFRPIGIGVSE